LALCQDKLKREISRKEELEKSFSLYQSSALEKNTNRKDLQEKKLLQELTKIEFESTVSTLSNQIEQQNLRYKADTEVLKNQAQDREMFWKKKLDSAKIEIENISKRVVELELSMKSEKTRRNELQSRLVADESVHNREIEELEKRNIDLQKRAEAAELSWTKLRMESLHVIGPNKK
jgi:hypothetical protein